MTAHMTRVTFSIALAFALTLTGCGGDDETPGVAATTGGPSPVATSTTPSASPIASVPSVAPVADVTQQELDAAVLKVSDLPTGWAKIVEEGDDETISRSTSKDCTDRWNALSKDSPLEAEAKFELNDRALIQQSIGLDPDTSVADVRALVEQCPKVTETADGEGADFSYSEASFPQLGDESVTFAFTLKSGSQTLRGYQSYVRKGDLKIGTAIVELFAPDAELLEKAIRATLART